MPKIRFSKQELFEYLKEQTEDEKLKQTISMIGTDLEQFSDEIIVEIFPNRPDLLSVPGLARAINNYLGYYQQPNNYQVNESNYEVIIDEQVKNIRPHTRCAVISNLSLNEQKVKQIIDLQEKLHITFGRKRKKLAIGIYPCEKISFPIYYTAKEPEEIKFQPLDSKKEMLAREILQDHKAGREYGHLLKGKNKYPLFIDNKNTVLSMPPIINSEQAGRVTTRTQQVFIECSGEDTKALEKAINIICTCLADMGGEIHQVTIKYPDNKIKSPNLKPEEIIIDQKKISELSGIPENLLKKSLNKMGLELKNNSVTIPCYRTDFLHPVDIAEDALIGYGYMNIKPTIPKLYTTGELNKKTRLNRVLHKIMTGLGMQQVITYTLNNKGIPLANPLNEENSCLRTELITSLLDVLAKNTHNSYPQKIYEIGIVFSDDESKETMVNEEEKLACVICEDNITFTTAKQVIETICKALGKNVEFKTGNNESFIKGRCAEVTGDIKGYLGEINPELLVERKIYFPAVGFEISF